MIGLLLATALCTTAAALTTVLVVRFSRQGPDSGTSGRICLALNTRNRPRAAIKRAVLIVTAALAHFALTLCAVALALWFLREPACSDDDCDCIDDCRTVVFKVEATSNRREIRPV
jgi:hypothetical protein